jgi:hypothetical protein
MSIEELEGLGKGELKATIHMGHEVGERHHSSTYLAPPPIQFTFKEHSIGLLNNMKDSPRVL